MSHSILTKEPLRFSEEGLLRNERPSLAGEMKEPCSYGAGKQGYVRVA